MQTSNVDWVSLFNDYKHSAPGVRACQLSEEPANPVTIKIGGLGGIGCSRYFVHTCGMNVFFCDSNSAEQFTEALYALKAYSVQ
jgi:hypothetical protein